VENFSDFVRSQNKVLNHKFKREVIKIFSLRFYKKHIIVAYLIKMLISPLLSIHLTYVAKVILCDIMPI